MMKASFVVAVPLALALGLVVAVTPVASAQTDPFVGTWKLNLAKSKFSPGPAPKESIVILEGDAKELTSFVQGVDGEGKPVNPEKKKNTSIIDGKDHPTTNPNPNFDTYAMKRIDANGFESTYKKAGKVVMTGTSVVSKDGRTTTVTAKGTNAKGETVNNLAVYDKQ